MKRIRRIMIEAEKCYGCRNCALACMNSHRTDSADKNIYTLNLNGLANESRNFIQINEDKKYKPLFCRHCDEPACVQGCMSGALHKDKDTGFVLYDKEKCGQCYMCVMNCPFGVLKADSESNNYVVKCDFCKDSGAEPNCVKMCPTGAIFVQEVECK